jgi:hypothetical protein
MTTLLSSPGRINLAGLTFNAIDDNGVTWAFDRIDGWHDGPSIDVPQVQRIVSHGQFAQAAHRGGRQITVEGWVKAEDRGLVATAVQSLATLLADGGFGTFEFEDDNVGTQWTTVQLLETPDLDWDTDRFTCRFQLALLASSPYKFGVESTASTAFAAEPAGVGLVFPLFPDGDLDFGPLGDVGQASVTNFGTASAPVVFAITGPTPTLGFVITDTVTGGRIQYLGQVPTGATLVIDSGAASVLIDGTADRLGDTIVDSWPLIPPGETRAFLFQPNGSATAATMTVSTTSTYW